VTSSPTQANAKLAPLAIKTERTEYKAEYTDEKFGPVKCAGLHVVSVQYPGNATSGGADKWTCKVNVPLTKPFTKLLYGTPGAPIEPFPEWASDYFALKGLGVIAKEVTATEGAGGLAYSATAVYPFEEVV